MRSRTVGSICTASIIRPGVIAASLLTPRWAPPKRSSPPPLDLPRELGDWAAAEKIPLDGHFLGSVRFSHWWHRRYVKGKESVSVFVGYDDRLRRHRSLVSRKNAFPGPGWEPEEEASIELEPGGPRVHSVQARSQAARTLSYHWYEGQASLAEEVLRASLAADQSRLRRTRGGVVARLSTLVEPGRDGRARADSRLRELAALLDPVLGEAGP